MLCCAAPAGGCGRLCLVCFLTLPSGFGPGVEIGIKLFGIVDLVVPSCRKDGKGEDDEDDEDEDKVEVEVEG